jgi:hypothetical protein
MNQGMDCDHGFVNANDGTRDKVCVLCKRRAMQAVMSMPPSAVGRTELVLNAEQHREQVAPQSLSSALRSLADELENALPFLKRDHL